MPNSRNLCDVRRPGSCQENSFDHIRQSSSPRQVARGVRDYWVIQLCSQATGDNVRVRHGCAWRKMLVSAITMAERDLQMNFLSKASFDMAANAQAMICNAIVADIGCRVQRRRTGV